MSGVAGSVQEELGRFLQHLQWKAIRVQHFFHC